MRTIPRCAGAGTIRARLEPLVLHELTYALPRVVKQATRTDIAAYIAIVLGWPGIQGEIEVVRDTVER